MKTIHNTSRCFLTLAAIALFGSSLLPSAWAAVPGLKITKLYSPTPGANQYFGNDLIMTDRYAIVGEPAGNSLPGSAHVFDAVTGAFVRTLKPSDSAPGDEFGQSFAAHGTKVLIGTSKNTGANAAYLFDVVTGKQLAKYQSNSGAPSENFAWTLALTETHALCADIGYSNTQGKVYVFDLATGASTTLTAPDGAAGDSFGYSIYCHGSMVVIGAPGHGGAKGGIYRWDLATGQFINKVLPANVSTGDYLLRN
jgi:FG-GAP repeat